MKKISIILFLCVSVCNGIFASAAIPGPYLEIQPNGDSIYVYWRADEYGSWNMDVAENNPTVTMNLEGLNSGVYVMRLIIDNQTVEASQLIVR